MDTTNKILELLKAISQYQENFVSSAYSTMGFLLLVDGWLVTSTSARAFIHRHKTLAWVGIFLAVVNLLAYAYISFDIQAISQNIYSQLASIPGTEGLYEHYLLSKRGVSLFILFQALATLVMIFTLCAIVKDPVLEDSSD